MVHVLVSFPSFVYFNLLFILLSEAFFELKDIFSQSFQSSERKRIDGEGDAAVGL